MRRRLQSLGRGYLVILITVIAIALATGLNTTIVLLFTLNLEQLAITNLKALVIALVVAPALSWHLVGLLFKLDKLEKKMNILATFDALTGLYNRRAFFVACDSAHHLARRNHQPYCLLVIDLDYFKNINDQFGHSGGDKLLTEFGLRLAKTFRASDISGRIGGEEFAVLLPNTTLKQAEVFAEKLRIIIAQTKINHLDHRVDFTISIGISAANTNLTQPIEDVLNQADQALYQAKHRGRNRVCIFNALSLHSAH